MSDRTWARLMLAAILLLALLTLASIGLAVALHAPIMGVFALLFALGLLLAVKTALR